MLEPRCPDHLAREIADGNCVAFVGAGFSAAAKLPDWTTLLVRLADEAECEQEVRQALHEHEGAEGRYLAAQLIEDRLGREAMVAGLRRKLVGERGEAMERRLALLRRIPFRVILTTNFDDLLGGKVASEDTYVEALRPRDHRWWEEQFWRDPERGGGAAVLKLHGDLSQSRDRVVLTRRDYRRRLYQDAGYQVFLRSILATRTVLYLGFSFTDAYLSELRSEVLSLLDFRAGAEPVAYAVVADAPRELQTFYRLHEGIEVLGYDSAGKTDFSGFDRWLEAIADATSPRRRFARLFAGRRVLWLDPHPRNNAVVHRFFAAIERERRGLAPVELVEVALAERACEALREAQAKGRPFDLVISHWGELEQAEYEGERLANGPRLLKQMRREDLRAPVVMFSTATELASRRKLALSLGARAYCYTFQALFRELEAVVGGE
jgi:CheY-like chemotaxis protein